MTLIPWMGGKRRLADVILPKFPQHACYVEAFAGGAALFFLKQPSEVEVLNDINGELVNLYRVVKHHLEEFIRQFKWALSSRQIFEWNQKTVPETLTDIQRAARFYYLQKLAFGGKVDGQHFGTATTSPPRLNLLRIEEELSEATCASHGPTSSTCRGTRSSRNTIALTRCFTAIRPIGRQRDTVWTSRSRSTAAWPIWPDPSRAA